MEKSGNAIPCKYDLTFSTARKKYGTIHCFEQTTVTKIDHGTAFSLFSVITEELCHVLSISVENESLSH